MSIGHDHAPRNINSGEPVPRDTELDADVKPRLEEGTVTEDTYRDDVLPQPREAGEDYIIPDTETSQEHYKKARRRTIGIATGAVALALTTGAAAAVFILTRGDDEPKDTGSRFPDATTSSAPLETAQSQHPITPETTSVVIETKPSTPEDFVPITLGDYVFIGEKAYTPEEAKEQLAIRGSSAQEAAQSARTLVGNLMTGGTNPRFLTLSASGNKQLAKDHLDAQLNAGLLSGVITERVAVDSDQALLTTGNLSIADLIVGHHAKAIDADQTGYSGGNISAVTLVGNEQIAQQGQYMVVKGKWAVNEYDRTGQDSTQGKIVDTDSYTVSMYLEQQPGGTWTIAKSSATKTTNG